MMPTPSMRARRTPPKTADTAAVLTPPRAANTPPVTAPLRIEFQGSSTPRSPAKAQSKVLNMPPQTPKLPWDGTGAKKQGNAPMISAIVAQNLKFQRYGTSENRRPDLHRSDGARQAFTARGVPVSLGAVPQRTSNRTHGKCTATVCLKNRRRRVRKRRSSGDESRRHGAQGECHGGPTHH